MPKFIVHLYPMMRVKLKQEIEADTYEQAAEHAERLLGDRHNLFDREDNWLSIEDGEECQYALVDVVGDEDYERSRWVHLEIGKSWGDRLLPALRELYRTAKNVVENHGPMSEYGQAMDDAHDLLQQIDDDIKLQKRGPDGQDLEEGV